ncbi:MAG: DNA methyltransferase [Alphaproteobacteria bacterium]
MDYLKSYKDKQFSLAIVDPEYGIDAANMTMGSGKNKKYSKKNWDKNIPTEDYFKQLFRVSSNQIICGGNYFTKYLHPTKSWIFWDKGIYADCSFADGELLWTSFNIVLRVAQIRYKGFLGADKDRIHITQKPIALYKWLLTNYAKEGDTILDTHGGSRSLAVACYDLGFDHVSIELDKDYHEQSKARFDAHVAKYAPASEIAVNKEGQVKLF